MVGPWAVTPEPMGRVMYGALMLGIDSAAVLLIIDFQHAWPVPQQTSPRAWYAIPGRSTSSRESSGPARRHQLSTRLPSSRVTQRLSSLDAQCRPRPLRPPTTSLSPSTSLVSALLLSLSMTRSRNHPPELPGPTSQISLKLLGLLPGTKQKGVITCLEFSCCYSSVGLLICHFSIVTVHWLGIMKTLSQY